MKTIIPTSIKLKDQSYYWVKTFSDSSWEVARYKKEADCFKFTDGGEKSGNIHEIGNEITPNMHDELVKQLQEMIRYSKVLAKNSHATQHLPIQEAEQLLKQAEQK